MQKLISIILLITVSTTTSLQGLSFAENPSAESASEADTSTISESNTNSNTTNTQQTDTTSDSSNDSSSKQTPPQSTSMTTQALADTDYNQFRAGTNLAALQNFQTDLFTGRATFSLPIAVSPGRRGIQPNLALTYASGNPNGPLGVGWSLELGAIERSTKKGTPKYDNSDTFIFNSGGSSVELVNIGGSEYRAKQEGAFMKFSFNGSCWLVTDKSGTKYYFNYSGNASQNSFKWCLDRVEDLLGNSLSITYFKDNNQIYPLSIDYLGGKVEFEWEGRSDQTLNYRTKFLIKSTQRLKNIRIKDPKNNLLRRYYLVYSNSSSKRSILISITQYTSNDTSALLPITFNYQNQTSNWPQDNSWVIYSNDSTLDAGARVVDVNNDTFADILRYRVYEGPGWVTTTHLYGTSESTPNTPNCWYAVASQDGESLIWSMPHAPGDNHPLTFVDQSMRDGAVRLADIDGDGWVDVTNNFDSWNGNIRGTYLNNHTTGWGRNDSWLMPDNTAFMNQYSKDIGDDQTFEYRDFLGVVLADVNGDGYTDVVKSQGDDRRTYLNNKRYGNNYTNWSRDSNWDMPGGADLSADNGTQLVDVNADGLADIVHAKNSERWVRLNNGNGWNSSGEWSLPDGDLSNGSTQFVDVNADGLADILYAKDSTRWVMLNHGSGWSSASSWSLPDVDFSNLNTQLADVNSDGIIDFLKHPNNNDLYVYTNPGPYPELLSSVDNGMGASLSIQYTSSAKFYNSNLDGIPDLNFPVQVVSRVETNDGQGNIYALQYEYENGFFDYIEREFRGFGEVRTIVENDDRSHLKTRSWFYQDSVKKGQLYLQEVWDDREPAHIYSRIWNVYEECTPYADYPQIKFPTLRETHNYTFDEQANSRLTRAEYDYDKYGNVILLAEKGDYGSKDKSGDDYIYDDRYTHTEYIYNETDWILNTKSYVYVIDYTLTNKVAESWFYYDGSTSLTTPPTNGLLTKEESWLYNPIDSSQKTVASIYEYDDYGNLKTATNPRNYTTTTNYENSYNMFPIQVINAKDQSVNTIYYGINETDAGIGFGFFGQVKYTTDPNGVKTFNIYDEFGRLKKAIGPNDTEAAPATYYEYYLTESPVKIKKWTKWNPVSTTINENDYIITYAFFDGLGRVLQTKSPAEDDPQTGKSRQVISGIVTYNKRGAIKEKYLPYFVSSIEHPASNYVAPDYNQPKFTFTYDAAGHLIQTTNPDGTYSESYFSVDKTASIDENNHLKISYSDAFGRVTKIEEYLTNNETQRLNRSAGEIPFGNSSYRIYATTNYEYDAVGNLIKLTDAHQNITQIWYDSLGRKIAMQDPDMGYWQYSYDEVGNLKEQLDNKGTTLKFEYDELNRLINKISSSSVSSVNSVSSVVTDSVSSVVATNVTYYYDTESGMSAEGGSASGGGMANPGEGFSQATSGLTYYKGRLVQVNDSVSRTKFFYDNLGREIQSEKQVSGVKYQVSRTYDALDRLTYLTYPDNTKIKYEYNKAGALEKVYTIDLETEELKNIVKNVDYSATGQITKIEYGNGDTRNYTYDPKTLRLTQLITHNSELITLQNLTYAFDNVGNVQGITDSINTNSQTFAYDGLNRLIYADGKSYGSINYTYDEIGNLKQKGDVTYTYPNLGSPRPHAVLSGSDGSEFTYDANGNMSSAKIIDAKGITQQRKYTYDQENRLIAVESTKSFTKPLDLKDPSGYNLTLKPEIPAAIPARSLTISPLVTKTTTTFSYDGDGGRVRKFYSKGSNYIENIYVGSLYEVVDSSLEPDKTRKHIFLGDTRVATIETLNLTPDTLNIYYFHGDHLGSSNLITDESGQVVQLSEYTPYGTLARSEGDVSDYKFTGKELDETTGLYFYESRYYDPSIGRFITPDTYIQDFTDPQTLNRYSYARNNPIIYVDPSGHFFWAIFVGIAKAIAAAVSAAVSIAAQVITTMANLAWTAMTNIGAAMWEHPFAALSGGFSGGYSAYEAGGDFGNIFLGAITGATLSAYTASFASKLETPLKKGLVKNFASSNLPNFVKQVLIKQVPRLATGSMYGATMGAVSGFQGGKGDFQDIASGFGKGIITGAAKGVVMGAASDVFKNIIPKQDASMWEKASSLEKTVRGATGLAMAGIWGAVAAKRTDNNPFAISAAAIFGGALGYQMPEFTYSTSFYKDPSGALSVVPKVTISVSRYSVVTVEFKPPNQGVKWGEVSVSEQD